MAYYDGTRLLSQLDLDGQVPEIYMACGNRSSGKTTWFNRFAVKKFLDGKGKFMTVFRYAAEMDDVKKTFFGEIERLFFQGHEFESEPRVKGAYHELFCDGCSCGYAVALNTADKLRRFSHVFADTERMIFDEFQAESGRYCPQEVSKFLSLHTTVARGGGKQVRYVPVYMISNAVSILNPYYRAMGISARINKHVKFLRGNGFVMEQNYNEDVAELQKASRFNTAFKGNQYLAYASQNVYLNDNIAFIEKVSGKTVYVAGLVYRGKYFGLRKTENGMVYCDTHYDPGYPVTISVTVDDHNVDQILTRGGEWIIPDLKYYFNNGLFRFQNMDCKEAVMTLLAI